MPISISCVVEHAIAHIEEAAVHDLQEEQQRWFAIIAPAGYATLTCYLLPYIWYPLRELLGIDIPGWYGFVGILISLAYALLIVQITRLLVYLGIKMKI